MKTERQVKTRIEQLQRKVDRLEQITNAPQQTPGPFVTGRSGYTMGKRLDAENERRWKAFRELQEAKGELSKWTAILKGYQSGECYLDGRPRADAPSKQRQATARRSYADFMKAHIKPGDTVALMANWRSHITVVRANKTTITDEMNVRWKYDDLLLVRDGNTLSDDEHRALYRAYREQAARDE